MRHLMMNPDPLAALRGIVEKWYTDADTIEKRCREMEGEDWGVCDRADHTFIFRGCANEVQAALPTVEQAIQDLTDRLEQAQRLQRLTETNEVAWMRKHSQAEAERDEVRAERGRLQQELESANDRIAKLTKERDSLGNVLIAVQVKSATTPPQNGEEVQE